MFLSTFLSNVYVLLPQPVMCTVMKAVIISLVSLNEAVEKNKERCSFAVIGGKDWGRDRDSVWGRESFRSSGELVKELAGLFHHCQSP